MPDVWYLDLWTHVVQPLPPKVLMRLTSTMWEFGQFSASYVQLTPLLTDRVSYIYIYMENDTFQSVERYD